MQRKNYIYGYSAAIILILILSTSYAFAVSCPEPIFTLADGKANPVVIFNVPGGDSVDTFRIIRKTEGLDVVYTKELLEDARREFRIYSDRIGYNECNSIHGLFYDFRYLQDSAAVLLYGYCLGLDTKDIRRFFYGVRAAGPEAARNLRSGYRKTSIYGCPDLAKAFDIIDRYGPEELNGQVESCSNRLDADVMNSNTDIGK